ncbi:CPBP family intramembrane glutamic endopeptidase [Trichothermofontia sp.]
MMTRQIKLRLLALLWVLGMLGVLALLSLPLPPVATVSPVLLRGLILLQPTLLLTLAVVLGGYLAPPVGLAAPVAMALVQQQSWVRAIVPQLIPGVIGGVAGGIVLSIITAIGQSFLPATYLAAAPPPWLVRLLYGGITEEILMRWGLMTLLVWLGWRWRQHRQGLPQRRWVVSAIVLSSLLFALAHLPALPVMGIALTPGLTLFLILQNSLFGLIAGYLYWRWGLEAAMLAHIVVHLVVALWRVSVLG